MIGKIYFDEKETQSEYGLLLGNKSVSAPVVRTNMIDVPGRDGLLDATDALTGDATFQNRTINLTLIGVKSVSGKEWPETISTFCNAVHGKAVKITFPEDTMHYYFGRASVGDISLYGERQIIPVTIDCDPWKYKNTKTAISKNDLGTAYKQLQLPNERRPVIPTITVEQDTTLLWAGSAISVTVGTHRFANICLAAGDNILKAKVASGTGSITVEYQEASL